MKKSHCASPVDEKGRPCFFWPHQLKTISPELRKRLRRLERMRKKLIRETRLQNLIRKEAQEEWIMKYGLFANDDSSISSPEADTRKKKRKKKR